MLGDVEQGEVVLVRLHVRGAVDLEAHLAKDAVEQAQSLGGGMQPPAGGRPAGQGHIHPLRNQGVFQRGLLDLLAAPGKGGFQGQFGRIGPLADRRPLLPGQSAQAGKDEHHRGAFRQVGTLPGLQAGFIADCRQLIQPALLHLRQLIEDIRFFHAKPPCYFFAPTP